MVYRGKCTLISKWTQHLNKPPIDSKVFMVKIVYKKNYFFKIMTVYLEVYTLKLSQFIFIISAILCKRLNSLRTPRQLFKSKHKN